MLVTLEVVTAVICKPSSLILDFTTTTLIWLNKHQKPEIKCSGFSDIWMNLKRIHDIIEVALFGGI